MEFLGLHYAIWLVLALYLIVMLVLGWWSKHSIHDQEGYLLGNRRFGVSWMVMHAFGTGTHPGDVAGVTAKTISGGASGIWVSWMWMFGTPFYWVIAPVVRRMRCLTVADFFEDRFDRVASLMYVIVATVGMTVAVASVILATTRTVQGMMGKAESTATSVAAEGFGPAADTSATAADGSKSARAIDSPRLRRPAPIPKRESDLWFFGILIVSTWVFVIYSFWGGVVAAVRLDMIQGLMIIALSFLAIPAAMKLEEVGGLAGMRATVGALGNPPGAYLSLFNPKGFSLLTVIVLCINAPLSMLAQPHLMTVCGAGKTEWEGRVGFTYGNVLKRICTMGWCLLALCWLAFLTKTGLAVQPDAAFGDSIRTLLSPVLQGVMLSCVLAAAMSTGDAIQVTVAGLFTQNVYRPYLKPQADQAELVRVTRWAGLVVMLAATIVAILMRKDVVRVILDFFNITGLVGIAVAMGLLWRRMNSIGMYCSTIAAAATFIWIRYFSHLPPAASFGWPIAAGVVSGIAGSLLTKPPRQETVDKFFKKIHVPIGEENRLELPLDEAVPPANRWLTAGGLFIVKPSRQSWIGFVVTLGVCLACVLAMLALTKP